MNRTATWLIAGLAVVVVLAFAWRGERGRAVPQLAGEPTVNLAVEAAGRSVTLPMEAYIQGVVAGEMGQLPPEAGGGEDWPHEAYAAQAILARSFALSFLNENGVVDITTDVEEAQAYASDKITPAISRAVEATRGMVLVSQGRFVKGWFHSYSGGHTATAKEGLNYAEAEPGFVAARPMPENEYVPDEVRAWQAAVPLGEVAQALRELGRDVGEVAAVEITERGPSGRATTLTVRGSGGSAEVHAADLRVALGPDRVRSTLFESLRVEGGNLIVAGRGYGHGVGLSQWDAFKLAKEGRSAEEILRAFFQDVEIVKAWD